MSKRLQTATKSLLRWALVCCVLAWEGAGVFGQRYLKTVLRIVLAPNCWIRQKLSPDQPMTTCCYSLTIMVLAQGPEGLSLMGLE